jgi:peptide deformylase
MILPIIAYGDPILKKEGKEIEKDYEGLQKLIDDMFETMYNASGVGLAAPQVGKSIRLFIVDASPFSEDLDEENPDPKAKDLDGFKKVFINPIIEEESGENWAFQEGCLSIPTIREDVFRQEKITISYFDENFDFHEESYEGYAARVIQHEYDHIDGILFTDHLSPLKKRMLNKKLNNISKGDVDINYRMKFPVKKRSK